MKYRPAVDSRPHPVYRTRAAHWAAVEDEQGRHIAQTGPFRSRREAFAHAEKMVAERQASIPGTAPDVAGSLQRKADAPIKPKVPQKACDAGLFSDDSAQIDLIDLLTQPRANAANR